VENPAKPVPLFFSLSLDLGQVKGRLDLKLTDLGATQLKNIAEPIRVYSAMTALDRRRRSGSRR
jgi:hypothetical protein